MNFPPSTESNPRIQQGVADVCEGLGADCYEHGHHGAGFDHENILIDKTSIEVFIDEGAYSYSLPRAAVSGNNEGLRFFGDPETEVISLSVYTLKSIWN